MPLDDWSIPGTLWLPALDTHTQHLVINSCTSPGMLWWKWLHDTVSPGPLGYAEEVGLRAVLSLDRDPPRALLWGQLSCGWTCTSLWVQWKLRDVCSQLKASGLSSGPGSDFSPREARSVGRGAVRERRNGSCYFLQILLLSLVSYSLSRMTFVPAAPKRSHFGEMSQASAWMILLHPSLLSLPPPVHPSSAFFYSERTPPWNSSAGKSNYIFSSGLPLKKASKSSLAETQGLFQRENVISRSFACIPFWVSLPTFLPC